MRLAWWWVLAGCATSAAPVPVIPAIHDRMIVFGQRVGPVSLGMTEQQLVAAAGTVKPTPYGGNRRSGGPPRPDRLRIVGEARRPD